jgi:hypothetical protein
MDECKIKLTEKIDIYVFSFDNDVVWLLYIQFIGAGGGGFTNIVPRDSLCPQYISQKLSLGRSANVKFNYLSELNTENIYKYGFVLVIQMFLFRLIAWIKWKQLTWLSGISYSYLVYQEIFALVVKALLITVLRVTFDIIGWVYLSCVSSWVFVRCYVPYEFF